MSEETVTIWARYVAAAYVILIVIGATLELILSNEPFAESIGAIIFGVLFFILLPAILAEKASDWAIERRGSPNLAYLLCFFLGLIPFIIYYFMIKSYRKSPHEDDDWECEHCGKIFDTEKECLKHEKTCKDDEDISTSKAASKKKKHKIRWFHYGWRGLFWVYGISFCINTMTGFYSNYQIGSAEYFGTLIGVALFVGVSYLFGYYKPYKDYLDSKKSLRGPMGLLAVVLIFAVVLPVVVSIFQVTSQPNCEYPKMLIGQECCLPNTDYGFVMCESEAIKLSSQLDNAIDSEQVTSEGYEVLADVFKVLIPPDYYAARNISVGELYLPLYLFSVFDDEYSTPILMYFVYFEDQDKHVQEVYNEFMDGAHSSFGGIKDEMQSTEPHYYLLPDNTELVVFNSTINYQDYSSEVAIAIIDNNKGQYLSVFYTTQEPYFTEYYYEFYNILNSMEIV